MKICEKCELCIAGSICAAWVSPTSVVCANFLKAVEAQKTAPNTARDEICPFCDPDNCDIQAVLEAGGKYCVECGRKLSPVA